MGADFSQPQRQSVIGILVMFFYTLQQYARALWPVIVIWIFKFDEINKAITKIKSNNKLIDIIDETNFTKNKYSLLASQVKSNLVSLEELKIKIESKIENIRIAYNGVENDEKNKGVINYIENKRKITDIENQITNLKEIISLLENKEKIQNQIEFLKKGFVLVKFSNNFTPFLLINNYCNDIPEKAICTTNFTFKFSVKRPNNN